MARQSQWDRRGAEWRDLALATGSAALIALLLAGTVALVWSISRSSSQQPVASVSLATTPTPRALVFARSTPTPATTGEVVLPAEVAAPAAAESGATPHLLALTGTGASGETNHGPLFAASRPAELSALAAGSWTVQDQFLVNEGTSPVAEPWLRLATVPGSSFAVEAEIRVDSVLSTVCDQSFGLAAGDPSVGAVYGAGFLFPCGNAAPVARLTNVALWEDGYNADPSFAEQAFDPEQDWHTYRFELRGDRLRLIVDGVGVASGKAPVALDPAATDAEAGIWSQGAAVEVRKLAIYPLPGG
jgi:hypothetical protein